jgi:hypothetical protein
MTQTSGPILHPSLTPGLQSRAGAKRRKFCPDSGLMDSGGVEATAVAVILRTLLKPLAVLIALGGLAFVSSYQLLGVNSLHWSAYVFLVLVFLVGVLLFSPVRLSLFQLRGLELVLFGAEAVNLVILYRARIVAAAAAGEPGLVLAEWNMTALGFILLMATYSIFIPNSWPRAALVVIPLALATPLMALTISRTTPEFAAMSGQVFSTRAVVDLTIILVLGAVISILGTALITRFRTATIEAREAGLYDLREKIGEGGMGEVWRAEHQTLARPTAIKIIRPSIVDGGSPERAKVAIRRFEREARATAGLRSPHTVEIYDFGVTGGGDFYYVMEFLEGVDLDTLVKQHGPMTAPRAIHLLRQACSSLADAHSRGLIHRDIKPANIYSCRMGHEHDFIKVLDFGLVKEQRPAQDITQLTVDGLTTGTPAYMAPEMAMQDRPVGPGTDIYSLGCVAYWLLTGKLVFEGETPMAIVVDHVRGTPVPPSERTELAVPAALDAIVLRCLAKDPADRFASMRELSAALASVELDGTWADSEAEQWWQLHLPPRTDLAQAS